jgi:hypothetical protein
VETLRSTITQLGGTPVPPCTYQFGVSNVKQLVATAQIFENTGVAAYDGAVNTISSEMLLTVAATIATIEARHAAYLNLLVEISPFPFAFDNATSPADIVALVSPFIASCPYTIDASILPLSVSSLVSSSAPSGGKNSPQPALSSGVSPLVVSLVMDVLAVSLLLIM